MRYQYYLCDIFTNVRFGGNQLAILPHAEGLSDRQMQKIARELNLTETTFVFPPESGHTRKVRIFTPTTEVPFSGHPNIGTAFKKNKLVNGTTYRAAGQSAENRNTTRDPNFFDLKGLFADGTGKLVITVSGSAAPSGRSSPRAPGSPLPTPATRAPRAPACGSPTTARTAPPWCSAAAASSSTPPSKPSARSGMGVWRPASLLSFARATGECFGFAFGDA